MEHVRILVIRLSAIGDCVLATPVPRALKARHPGAHITWVVESKARDVVSGIPGVDELLVWQASPNRGEGMVRALAEVRRREFDVALDLQGLAKAGAFLGCCRAPRRVTGSRSKSLARFAATEIVPESSPVPHAVRVYLRRAAALGIDGDDLRPAVPVQPADREFARRFLAERLPGWQGPVIGFNIGASKRSKCWPPRYFAAVADALLHQVDGQGIIFGGRADVGRAERMLRFSRRPERLHMAAGQTMLMQLAALTERCLTVITTDSGPMHITAAMDVPVVALFGPSQPRHTGPYGEDHQIVDAVEILTRDGRELPVAQTHYGRRFGRVDDLSAITPAHVLDAAHRIWPAAQARLRDRQRVAEMAYV